MKSSSNISQPKIASQANAVQLRSQPGAQAVTITDNRPMAIRQRKIQEAIKLAGQQAVQLKPSTSQMPPVSVGQGPSVVQRVIHKGKTHRSKPYTVIKSSGWYKSLTDRQRLYVDELQDADNSYTGDEALAKIINRIKKGRIPLTTKTPKQKRLDRIRAHVNSNTPDSSAKSFIRGRMLARASERAYKRHMQKYRKDALYKSRIKTVNDVTPGLFSGQTSILGGASAWQQIVSVTHATPQSFDLNIGGSQISLDSIKYTSNADRSEERDADPVHLPQLFIEQPGGENSYWKMSDSDNPALANSRQHQQLVHLEVERKNEAAFTTYLKNLLIQSGNMTTEQAFGDEGTFAYQEYKGALKPTAAMLGMQTASAYEVLEHAIAKAANDELGTKVATRALTTATKIKNALKNYAKDQTEIKLKVLVKEIFRLIRVNTREDVDSDSEVDC